MDAMQNVWTDDLPGIELGDFNCRNPGSHVTWINSESCVKGQFVLGNLSLQIFIYHLCT